MRLSTSNTYVAAIDNLMRRQTALSTAQEQMSSLKRVNHASDDPTAAARAERAIASLQRNEADQRAVQASQTAMQQTEGALGDAGELLQQAREALLGAGNGSYSDSERQVLAQQVRAIRAQLLTVANRGDGAGNYLFGGQGSATPPFVDGIGGVSYAGAPGETKAASSEALPLSADGRATWLAAPTGNGTFQTSVNTSTGSAVIDGGVVIDAANVPTPLASYRIDFSIAAGVTSYTVRDSGGATVATAPYQAGQAIQFDGMSVTVKGLPANGDRFDVAPSTASLSVFDALDRVATELETTGRSPNQIEQANAFALRDVDGSLGRLQLVRSHAGEVLNRIDNITGRLAEQQTVAENERSSAEDLDMVKAISAFKNQQTGYDAALQSYAMVQRMSLFNYLS